jgi:hypothetical protein
MALFVHKNIIKSKFDSLKLNIFSQNGEDGVVKYLLEALNFRYPLDSVSVVEFGAWDGIYFSNTFNLIINGASGLYIEGDKKKYRKLLDTTQEYIKITPCNTFVSSDINSSNNLGSILDKYKIRLDFEVLSIDVDGLDLEIFKTIGLYRPKIIIIEIISEYGPDLKNEESPSLQGATFRSAVNLFESYGYLLICHIGNLIFINKEFESLVFESDYKYDPFKLYNNYWENLSIKDRFLDKAISILLKYSYILLGWQTWLKLRRII